MDIIEFINLVKKRLETFIGEPTLEKLSHFIDGFMANNFLSNRDNENDQRFKKDFSEWCQKVLAKEFYNLIDKNDFATNNSRGYLYFINVVENDERKKINIFFKLVDCFFDNGKQL